MKRTRAPSGWVVPLVIAALVVGLAGLGVGVYAVAAMPSATSGPRGPAGAKGDTGLQGASGVTGAVGPTGPAGPAGTIASTSIVSAATMTSAANPPVGTVLVAKTSCPIGKILLSGTAQVAAPGIVADLHVQLRVSIPLSADVWQTVAIVTAPLGPGVAMSMTPYVVCGVPSRPAATTTTTTASAPTVPTT